jgi:DNA-binding CsgD family transcriptional regulator
VSTPLARRERQVLAAVAHGMSNREVAAELGIAVATVHSHLASAYFKLGIGGSGVRTPIDAFRILGWLRPPTVEEV